MKEALVALPGNKGNTSIRRNRINCVKAIAALPEKKGNGGIREKKGNIEAAGAVQ